jgi:chaperonin GroEL (HSP60 family)
VIKVGAATDVELKERKHRIEDAVRNTKAPWSRWGGAAPGGHGSKKPDQTVIMPPVPRSAEVTGSALQNAASIAGLFSPSRQ